MIELRNGRVSLALHALQLGEGAPLLLLHEQGGSAEDFRSQSVRFGGAQHALDFSGHGCSGWVQGGGYYPELWAADADAALSALTQPSAHEQPIILGRGLGAYVALLLAGGRHERVRCAVLASGAGLLDGSADPLSAEPSIPDLPSTPPAQQLRQSPVTDPSAFAGQPAYPRPPAYAARFAARARRVLLVEDGGPRPAWWRAVGEVAGVERYRDVNEALDRARAQ